MLELEMVHHNQMGCSNQREVKSWQPWLDFSLSLWKSFASSQRFTWREFQGFKVLVPLQVPCKNLNNDVSKLQRCVAKEISTFS